jgi:uncharacterized iron-regulated membrane protein
MQRRAITAWMFVHRWTSLACTGFLLLLCVTGLPLIFHAEIDRLLAPPPPLADLGPDTPPMPLDRLLAGAVAAHPGERPLYLSWDEERPIVGVTTAPTPTSPASAMHFQTLDARTGRPVPVERSAVMDLLLSIHTDLTLGFAAELMLGGMGLLFVVSIVSGVVVYAPFMAKLRFGTVREERSPRVRRLDRHNLLGIVTLAWALVVGATGVLNTLALPITQHWKADQLGALVTGGTTVAPVRISVDRALAAAGAAAPGMRPQFIAFPGVAYSSNRHIAIFLQGTTPFTRRLLTPVFVGAGDGRLDLVGRVPWYMKALLLAEPLHFGDYGGLPLKFVWAVLDALTIAVLWTGLRLWQPRRRGTATGPVPADPVKAMLAMEEA